MELWDTSSTRTTGNCGLGRRLLHELARSRDPGTGVRLDPTGQLDPEREADYYRSAASSGGTRPGTWATAAAVRTATAADLQQAGPAPAERLGNAAAGPRKMAEASHEGEADACERPPRQQGPEVLTVEPGTTLGACVRRRAGTVSVRSSYRGPVPTSPAWCRSGTWSRAWRGGPAFLDRTVEELGAAGLHCCVPDDLWSTMAVMTARAGAPPAGRG